MTQSAAGTKPSISIVGRVLAIIVAVAVFLFALSLLGHAFKMVAAGRTQQIMEVTSDPFISLFIGLLMTAVIQSSSTTTSMVVAAVAAGSLNMAQAVPMIMGANIGTTLTSTLVSLGFITKKKEFKKALAAGTVHDIFNVFTTIILLPLELYTGFLSSLAQTISGYISLPGELNSSDLFTYGFWHNLSPVQWMVDSIDNVWVVLLLAFVLLFASIKVLAHYIYELFIGSFRKDFERIFFATPLKAFAFGGLLTATVQSSSVTTPLVVPLVATGKISLKKCYPYIMGANLGTTVTAFLAALFHSNAAISIALVHVLFNLFGVLIFFPIKVLRNVPIKTAQRLGRITNRNRIIGFMYILLTFFLLPFILIYISQQS
ncbi:Na/Pi symporter [Cesiribacter sp. SM1]|uniref:Na/Pi symporter n=1 Tax=Cesiribacter sp. SM1 TaxID=2861196 RepID=UPI001CD1F780|nr:Na/Pi symporter [Cesiribacter sp. SM1]